MNDNLIITDTFLEKLNKCKSETLKFTTSESVKYDSILDTLSNEEEMRNHLAKHETWVEQVNDNRANTENEIEYWTQTAQETKDEIREQNNPTTLSQQTSNEREMTTIINSPEDTNIHRKPNLKKNTENKNLKNTNEKKPTTSRHTNETQAIDRDKT